MVFTAWTSERDRTYQFKNLALSSEGIIRLVDSVTYYLWCGDGESVCDVWNVPYLRPHRPCWIHTTPFLGPQCCRIQRNSCSSLEVKHSRHFPAAVTPASFDVHLLSFASCVGVTQPVLRLFFFFRGSSSICSCTFGVFVGGGAFRILFPHHFGPFSLFWMWLCLFFHSSWTLTHIFLKLQIKEMRDMSPVLRQANFMSFLKDCIYFPLTAIS